MKKLVYILLFSPILFSSCQKDETKNLLEEKNWRLVHNAMYTQMANEINGLMIWDDYEDCCENWIDWNQNEYLAGNYVYYNFRENGVIQTSGYSGFVGFFTEYESWCIEDDILKLEYYIDSLSESYSHNFEILKITNTKLKIRKTPYQEMYIGNNGSTSLNVNGRQYEQIEFESN